MKFCLLLPLLCLGCSLTPEPVPPAPIPDASENCWEAQQKLKDLDCRRDDGSSWWKTPAGTPFGEACFRAASDGRNWHPECISQITDCSQLMNAYRAEYCPL